MGIVSTMDSRVAGLIRDFTPSLDDFEAVVRRHIADYFGCDAAYFATVGPHFVERSPEYFQRILADPEHFDPGQRKAREIAARFGTSFVDTAAYTRAERDRLPIFRELLRPAGLSSVVLATVNLGQRMSGMVHVVRSGRPFSADVLVAAQPLLRTVAILHSAIVGAPASEHVRSGEPAALVARLSRREREVAALAAKGFGATQISAHLGTSVHTIRRQLESIYAKCGIGNRVELAGLVQRARGDVPAISPGLLRILGSVRLHPAVRAAAA